MNKPEVWPSSVDQDWAVLRTREQQHLRKRRKGIVDHRERKLCVSWLIRACEEYGFRPDVCALAIQFYDSILDCFRVKYDPKNYTFKQMVVAATTGVLNAQQHKESAMCELICIICISIAAKKLEPKEKAPYLGDFEDYYQFSELQSMEHRVLDMLNWDLASCTALDFVHVWLAKPQHETHQQQRLREDIQKLVEISIKKCMRDAAFAMTKPSLLGTASMLWAHRVIAAKTGEYEATRKWERQLADRLATDWEDMLMLAENIGSVMALDAQYENPFSVDRAESPSTVVDLNQMMAREVLFPDSQTKSSKVVLVSTAVKRPMPEWHNTVEAKKQKTAAMRPEQH